MYWIKIDVDNLCVITSKKIDKIVLNKKFNNKIMLRTYMFLYVGFEVLPPEYPTLVRKTPCCPPNNESPDQKQPIPNVAFSKLVSTLCNGLMIPSSTFC